jgi:hypothetical protein
MLDDLARYTTRVKRFMHETYDCLSGCRDGHTVTKHASAAGLLGATPP